MSSWSLGFTLLLVCACTREHRTDPSFSAACPDPIWLDSSAPVGCSHAEMRAIYLSVSATKMSSQRLASAGFMAMKVCGDDPEVALYGLMIMPGLEKYPELEGCANHFLTRDFAIRSRSDPDPSYHVAGAVGQVGQALLRQGNPAGAARLFDRLYKERGAELPPWVAQGYGYYYADALSKTGRTQEGIAVLQDLIRRFDTREDGRLTGLLNQLEKQVAPRDVRISSTRSTRAQADPARDNAVLNNVLLDLLAYSGKDSPVQGKVFFDPHVAKREQVVDRDSAVASVLERHEKERWELLTQQQLAMVSEAADRLVDRYTEEFEYSSIDSRIGIVKGETARESMERFHRPVHAALPGYSDDGTIALVSLSIPWSGHHSAKGTYVLVQSGKTWEVVLRQFIIYA